MIKKCEVYETSDLYLAAYLCAKKMEIIDKRKQEKKYIFIFRDMPERKQYINDFFNEGLVSIREFRHALQDLKTMVFSSQE